MHLSHYSWLVILPGKAYKGKVGLQRHEWLYGVLGIHLDRSHCAASRALLWDTTSWSASSSRTFSTASCPSFADRASFRSSTCDINSLMVRSVRDWSEFHLSAWARAMASSLIQVEGNRWQITLWGLRPYLKDYTVSVSACTLMSYLGEETLNTGNPLSAHTFLWIFGSLYERNHLLIKWCHFIPQQLILQTETRHHLSRLLLNRHWISCTGLLASWVWALRGFCKFFGI